MHESILSLVSTATYFWLVKNSTYSGSFPYEHSLKRTALVLTAAFSRPRFFSTPIQTPYFFIPVSGQLHLRTPFSSPEDLPEGVRLRQLPLYILYTNHTYP